MAVENDYRDKKFLIVDDFESFQKILKRMLHGLNVKDIDTATSGSQAIRFCEEHEYDVIFSDLDLGKGPNGLQMLEELRHKDILKHSCIFIMVTADSSRDAVVGTLEYKPDAYMNKPISPGEIQSRLLKCIKQKDNLKPIYTALDQEDFDQALMLCEQEITNKSRNKNWCLKTKGEILLNQERFDEAEQHYQAIVEERPLFWARMGLADVYLAIKKFKQALNLYEECYSENPASLEAYEGAAQCLVSMGNTKGAQSLLERSTTISSRSVKRQKLLAEISRMNNDYDTAAKASRSVVRLAEHSIHENAENELDLADSLSEAALHTKERELKKAYAKEALNTSQATQKKYANQDIKIQAKLIESRAYASSGDDANAQRALESAESRIDRHGTHTLRSQLELAKSYLQTGHKDKGFALLKQLAQEYKHDKAISQRLDKLVDEPVTAQGREAVVKINKEGINLFERGEYQAALDSFSEAVQFFPKHVGIRLNIIQALLFDMKKSGPAPEKIALCKQHIEFVDHIEGGDKQFKRYQQFKNTLEMLQKHGQKETS
ncbi:response regulator [Bermanella marisrubri]|uniref:CheY-like receiver protein n=1 Tax=Bermanella marisrubri TaxID=207949 RepID=Q1N5M6_9GAMM|nr:tetratricopeptide repeat-containing response regulator [Bermanella marisrubri]EAT13916.1 CheY-like receiver protein [Oceanobacter sp. RED65] [Bermanella marisrubri]QIZ84670.1 response regulator [Bermanella marisrubri]